MKKFSSLLALLFISGSLLAQHSGADSMPAKVTVTKDPRLDILAKAEAEIEAQVDDFDAPLPDEVLRAFGAR